MDHAIVNQAKAKAEIAADDFIIFSEENDSVKVSGTVINRSGDNISVLFENDSGYDTVIEFDLNKITLYNGKEWENKE